MHGFGNPSIATPIPEWVRIKDEIYEGELNKAVLGLTSPSEALAHHPDHLADSDIRVSRSF